LVEVLLFAPRLTISAWRDLRERARLRHVTPRLAADVLDRLLRHDGGVPPAEIAAAHGDIRGSLDAILYLAFHEWIGFATDRRRVWVHSDDRRKLDKLAAGRTG
jgi:hypothetical protein